MHSNVSRNPQQRQQPDDLSYGNMHLEGENNGSSRYAQVREETNHKHCSDGNQKALLAERLNGMRSLIKDIRETDWIFDKNKGRMDAPQPLGKGVERHFSLGRRV